MAERKVKVGVSAAPLELLAEFRHQLRSFLHFSEMAALKCDLQPQQHQLLLQIAGAPDGMPTTLRYVSARLSLRHHTVVELSNRCEKAGLLVRKQAASDRRFVVLRLTPKAWQKLEVLSADHARELNELAPKLIRTLTKLKAVDKKMGNRMAKRDFEIGI